MLLGFLPEPVVNLFSATASSIYSECSALLQVDHEHSLCATPLVESLESRGESGLIDIAMLDLLLDTLEDYPDLVLGYDVSPLTVADGLSWSAMIKRLEQAGPRASRLILQISKSAFLQEIACARIRLKAAKTLGCRIAISDFSLTTFLPRLARGGSLWDIIRLDRSCLAGISNEGSVVDVLRPTFEMASCIAPTVVIVGVETESHLNAARSVGAQYVQTRLFTHSDHRRFTRPELHLAKKIAAYFSKTSE